MHKFRSDKWAIQSAGDACACRTLHWTLSAASRTIEPSLVSPCSNSEWEHAIVTLAHSARLDGSILVSFHHLNLLALDSTQPLVRLLAPRLLEHNTTFSRPCSEPCAALAQHVLSILPPLQQQHPSLHTWPCSHSCSIVSSTVSPRCPTWTLSYIFLHLPACHSSLGRLRKEHSFTLVPSSIPPELRTHLRTLLHLLWRTFSSHLATTLSHLCQPTSLTDPDILKETVSSDHPFLPLEFSQELYRSSNPNIPSLHLPV